MDFNDDNLTESHPVVAGGQSMTESAGHYPDCGSSLLAPPTSPETGQSDVVVGEWKGRDVPFASASMVDGSAEYETARPSLLTGGTAPEVMAGVWELVGSENVDDHLYASIFGKQKTSPLNGPRIRIEKLRWPREGTWKMTSWTDTRTAELLFKLDGKEREKDAREEGKLQTKFTWDDGTLTQWRYVEPGEEEEVVRRIFKKDDLEVIPKNGNHSFRLFYKRTRDQV